MVYGCLPHVLCVVQFFKRLRNGRLASPESSENSPLLQPPQSSSDQDLERVRLLVDDRTSNFIFPISPTSPTFPTGDHAHDTNITHFRPSPSSPTYLAPPSPIRSTLKSSESDFDSIISREHFVGSNASSFSNEVAAAPDLPDSGSPLEENLYDARMEWPEGSVHYFLPVSAIEELVTVESIEEQLAWRNVRLPPGQSRHQLASRILRSAPKLFCVLVLLQKTEAIVDFLQESLDDIDLPCTRDSKMRSSGRFRLCSQQRPNQPITSMMDWTSKSIQDFSREQWSVLAPIFIESEKIEHYIFDDNCVLPFMRDEKRNHVKVGGGGKVWEVDIHPAHHSFHCKILNPSFALKRLHSPSRALFESEVEMLKPFSDKIRRHENLVRLLATFEYKGGFYLLFPWAKANLRDYWMKTPAPQFSELAVKWMLRQCKGIASGLLRIHGYQNTLEALGPIDMLSDHIEEGRLDTNGRIYSRHGDIKPENILWSDEDAPDDDPCFQELGVLLISDFGLMTAHKELTEFRQTPEEARGSTQYQPPEIANPRATTVVSRAYDIWSLGCVYLEFVTWIVDGFEGVENFRKARSKGDDAGTFFVLTEDVLPGRPRKAIVKNSVQDCIKHLRRQPRCSDFIQEFLHLITDDMLVIDPRERIHCGPLNEKLTEMVIRADRSSKYLVLRKASERNPDPVTTSINVFHPILDPVDGSPLPKRPSVVRKPDAIRKAQPLSQTHLHILSQPSSPRSCEYAHRSFDSL